MKKILLTGATGFVGQHCLPRLIERGYEVHAVSSKAQPPSPQLTWHQFDLLNTSQISTLVSEIQPNYLLHLAWYVAPGKWYSAVENFQWVQASLELLRQFHEYGGQRVVMAGSGTEYDWNYGYCSEFLTPQNANTFYGRCKNSLYRLLESYADVTELSSVWGRIFFLYGPYENPNRLVASVIRSILKGEPALCSHGRQIRDFLHVKDAADAFITLLENDISGPVNIASGRAVALRDIIFKIAQKLDGHQLVRLGAIPAAANDTRLVVADVSRLFDEVGWQPEYDLDSGLDQTIEWWRSQLKV